MVVAVIFFACNKEYSEAQADTEEQMTELQTTEDLRAYLKDQIVTQGLNTPQNPERFKKIAESENSTFRSCIADCDYDIEDCSGLSGCTTSAVITETINVGCPVDVSYSITKCKDSSGEYVYFQINYLGAFLLPGCTHSGVNYGFDINYPGGSKASHEANLNLILGSILNYIEESVIYDDYIDPAGSTGYGNIVTVVDKDCYTYCSVSDDYISCGTGCCVRITRFDADDGYVSEEWTQNAEGVAVGSCPDATSVSCGTNNIVCDNQLDCDIVTWD